MKLKSLNFKFAWAWVRANFWRLFLVFIRRATVVALIVAAVVAGWFLWSFGPKYQAAGEALAGKDINALFALNSTTGVFDRDGKLLVVLGEQKPKFYQLSELDPRFIKGLLAVEDRRYYAWWRQYLPVDPWGILRAIKNNAANFVKAKILRRKVKENLAGGSTILQMFSREVFPEVGRGRTIDRKLWELAYSYHLVHRYDREQLLAAFVCRANFGSVNGVRRLGLEQAADGYYQKKVEDLTLDEVATLVGVLNANTAYSPVLNPVLSQKRRSVVLGMWEDEGVITAEVRQQLANKPIVTNPKPARSAYGEFPTPTKMALEEWQTIRRQLVAQGVALPPDELLRIETTLHSGMQDLWVKSFRSGLAKLPKGLRGAGGVMDWRTGEMLSLYGGEDFFNRFTDSARQPGSVFKLFVYAIALAKGVITPDSVFMDEPRSFMYEDGKREYKPENFKGEYSNGPMTAREALAKSKNVIAVAVAEKVGYDQVVQFARQLGLELVKDGKGNLVATPAIALGAYEVKVPQLMSALTVFANSGWQATPRYIRSVTGSDGKEYYRLEPVLKEQTTPEVAAAITNMMVGCAQFGTGEGLFPGLIALKTGSSRDGWLVGFAPGGLLFVVYVGYDNPTGEQTTQVTGAGTAGKVAGPFLAEAAALKDPFVQSLFAGTFPTSNWTGGVMSAEATSSPTPAPSPTSTAGPCPTWRDCLKMTDQPVEDAAPARPAPTASPVPSPSPRTWREYQQAMPKPTQPPPAKKQPVAAPPSTQSGPCVNWRDCLRQSKP